MNAALLELRDVVAGYAEPVVGPLSFAIEPGEVVGLAGANGAGKSTVLGAIIGTTRLFAGVVRRREGIKVAVQAQVPFRRKEMPLTGIEILRLTGADRQEAPASLRPLLGLRLDRMSGGQYQLVNVWACLGCPAQLVLLDEPTNNMDPRATAALEEVVRASRREGRGMLIVSHEHEFLERVSTRLVEVARR
jgi:zinc transport system ATP-binding protein